MDEKATDYVNGIIKEDEDDVIDTIRLYEAYRDGWEASRQPVNNLTGSAIVLFIFLGFAFCAILLKVLNDFFHIKIFVQ